MSHKVSSFQGVLIRESFYPGFHTGFFGVWWGEKFVGDCHSVMGEFA